MHQTTLTDNSADELGDTTTTEQASSSGAKTNLAPPGQRGGEGCCPWCLAATETFKHHENGRVGCGYCDAVILVGTSWYERGEKVVV